MHNSLQVTLVVGLFVALATAELAQAQSQTLASALDVSVFPADGQDSTQQSKDEAECYEWAVEDSGSDPFKLIEQQEERTEQTEEQLAAAEEAGKNRGVLKGAAAGALVGEVTGGDAGDSAAIGAGVGVLSNRRHKKKAHQQEAQVEQQAAAAEQATEKEIERFMNGFTACLEAKDYVAKH